MRLLPDLTFLYQNKKIYSKIILIFMMIFNIISAPILIRPTPIPRIIHYVWVGGKPLPELSQLALRTWKKYAPGYRIIKWDETNCPINNSPFARKAYSEKNWAFVSDYCRFYALNKYGGIYMDTDQYLIKDIRKTFNNKIKLIVFWESGWSLVSGIIAGAKSHPVFSEIQKYYETTEDFIISPILLSQTLQKHITIKRAGLYYRDRNEIVFYPPTVALINLGGPETIGLHGYNASWVENGLQGHYRGIVYDNFFNSTAIQVKKEEKTDYLIPYMDTKVYRLSDKKIGQIIKKSRRNLIVRYHDGKMIRYPRGLKKMPHVTQPKSEKKQNDKM